MSEVGGAFVLGFMLAGALGYAHYDNRLVSCVGWVLVVVFGLVLVAYLTWITL